MNPTIEKFGYPETLIETFGNWAVLLRPQQVTLGSLVLACTEPAKAFSQISRDASAELVEVAKRIESTLAKAFDYDKINYLMLMMVDPDVHFHVFPRYAQTRRFADKTFQDLGWPGPPALQQVNATTGNENSALVDHLRSLIKTPP